jgi:hypothetical protein
VSEQSLNSLDRFRKRSPRLMLEQHAGCEVPAGCGGVVMRWRNPLEARPVRVHIYAAGEFTASIDGEELRLGRLDLRPGRHVLAVELSKTDRWSGLLMVSLRNNTHETACRDASNLLGEAPFHITSAADGTWRYMLDRPSEGWTSPGLDDSGWGALVDRPIPEPGRDQPNQYQHRVCREEKAAGLGLPDALRPVPRPGFVWVRKVFEIPKPTAS